MNRIELKKDLLSEMIKIYCIAKHKKGLSLCEDCKELQAYAVKRAELCRHKNEKITCRKCPAQCYSKEMKQRIIEVMRFSGIRIFFRRPIDVIKYMI